MDERQFPKRKIMVTGGAGLIGFEACKQLHFLGHEVHLFDLGEQIIRMKSYIPEGIKVFYGSVLDTASLRSCIADCEIVIHFGALLGVKRSESEKLRCLEVNIDGTKNVLECSIQHRVKKFVFASSSEVYGEPLINPISESDITQGKTVYAITKLAGEELCKAYSQKYPLEYTILRYFNCYGPFQTAQFVIAKFISNVLDNKPPIIYGDGNQIRSYTYVQDTARATILAALNPKASFEVLNIGNGAEPITLRELANLVIKAAGKEGMLKPEHYIDFSQTDRTKEREINTRYCNAQKAEKILDWKAEIKLVDGIKKVLDTGVIFKRWENLNDELT